MPIITLCKALEISRSWYYYKPEDSTALYEKEFSKISLIRTEYHKHPFYGYRKIAVALKDYGLTNKTTRRLMKKMGLRAIYPAQAQNNYSE